MLLLGDAQRLLKDDLSFFYVLKEVCLGGFDNHEGLVYGLFSIRFFYVDRAPMLRADHRPGLPSRFSEHVRAYIVPDYRDYLGKRQKDEVASASAARFSAAQARLLGARFGHAFAPTDPNFDAVETSMIPYLKRPKHVLTATRLSQRWSPGSRYSVVAVA